MRTINLTVIADRSCSTSRTYLTYLKAAGLKPKNLWLVDFGACSPIKRLLPVSRTLPAPYLSEHAGYRALCLAIQAEANVIPIDYFATWNPADYAEETTYLRARDFEDAGLQARMKRASDTAFLYTNGGIVPSSILSAAGIRVLHIHPGMVPQVRGSDCLLWSVQTRQKIGISCFYMNAGIDEGDLIAQAEWPVPKLPSLAAYLNPSDEPLAYRAVLFALDPHYRAQMLLSALGDATDLRALPSSSQPPHSRPAFLWLHPRLRLRFMRDAFL